MGGFSLGAALKGAATAFGMTGEAFAAAPVAASLGVAGAAVGAGQLVAPVGDAVKERFSRGSAVEKQIVAEVAMTRLLAARKARQQRLDAAMAQQEALLAQQAPDLYTNVITGRRWPKGTIPIGGRPRKDLMQRLTQLMAQGQFQQQER